MITFKNSADLDKLGSDHPAYPVVKDLVEVLIEDFNEPGQSFNPDQFGYVALVEPEDTDRVLTDLDMPWTLADIPWEGASKRRGYIYAVYLGTDDYGMGFVIPDAKWINGRLRKVLEGILD